MDDPVARIKALSLGDKVIAVALVVAFIAMFLPWYGVSCSAPSCRGLGGSTNGFYSWGYAYFIFWLVVTAFFVLRLTGSSAIDLSAIKFPDWQILLVGAALMLITGLLYYTAVQSGSIAGISYGVSFGWFIALLAAVAVGVGAYLRRTEVVATPPPATNAPV